MPAVPIYVWNGTAWQETGPTIPANPIKYQASAPSSPSTGDIWVDSDGDVTTGSQQFQRFRFVASGGETTISGNDANGATLAYTAGLEQVVLNGAVLVRGHDYTATNGTSITGLSPALVANDVLEVFSFIAFTVANTYTQAQVDGLVDAAPGMKLIVPSSAVNGTVSATGAVTFTTASSVSLNSCFTSVYENYKVLVNWIGTADDLLYIRFRASGTDNTSSNYYSNDFSMLSNGTTISGGNTNAATTGRFGYQGVSVETSHLEATIFSPQISTKTTGWKGESVRWGGAVSSWRPFGGSLSVTTSYDGFTLVPGAGTITGTVRVYGYKN
jgi:hypothetical protein